jgi:PRC-barrel domain/Heat induced stress protein YflT domain/Alternative complex III, ActD subunit
MLSTLRDYQDRSILDAIRGTNVYGREDSKLGSVEDGIVDADFGELRYLVVNAGWLDKQFRRFAVPADQVYGYRDTGDLYVNLSTSEAEALPAFEDACVASQDAFTTYEREYQNAWRPRGDTTQLRASQRLLRLRDRLRNASRGTLGEVAEPERESRKYPPANLSGSVVNPTTVYGVYPERKDVERTVSSLKDQGFGSGDISVVFPNADMTKEFAVQKNTKAPEGALAGGGTGLVIGGVLGWLAGIGTLAIPGIGPLIAAGPIVAALAGAGAGSAIGGIAGALIGLGLPELEAKRYEEAIKQGRILVSIHCQNMRQGEAARKILDDSGAKEVFLSGERKAA